MNSFLTRLHDRLGLRTSPAIFFASALVIIVFTVAMGAFPGPVQQVFGVAAQWLRYDIGWFYTASATCLVVFAFGLAFSRFGRVKLGDDDATPEHSGIAWFGMLFAAGVGAVLMFWGIAEPMNHYANPPLEGTDPYTDQALMQAINFANLHFGIHMWGILLVPGLCFGYFTYKRKLPPRVSSAFQPILGDGIHGPIGKTIDVVTIVSTVFGIGVSTGLGALQINAGMNYVFGTPIAGWVQALIMAVITAAALTSVLAGMDKGVKRLSYINICMAVAFMLYCLMWAESSLNVLRGMVESVGRYVQALPMLTTFSDTLGGGAWSGDWTVFYWAWTVSWAPFVGLFVAKISRGRTIREFVFAGIGIPTAFVIIWMGVYGFSSYQLDRSTASAPGAPGEMTQTIVVDGNVQAALFQYLQHMPLYLPVATFALLIIVIFFVTSIDSGALVMDAMASGHEEETTRRQRVFWGLSIGLVCTAIITTAGEDGLDALQEVIIVIGFPVMVLTLMQAALLLRALREDAGSLKPMRTRQWKPVLPAEEYHRRAQEGGVDITDYSIRPQFEVGTEPEYDTHTPNTWHQQKTVAERAAVTIGMSGAVASGKSLVASEFARHGAVVVDYDDLMHELLVAGHPAVRELGGVFGEDMVRADGSVDWTAVDALTTESTAARTRLYEVVDPHVKAEANRRAAAIGDDAVLVVDLALLDESSSARDFDRVIVVESSVESRVERLMAERGLTREQAWAEIDADAQDGDPSDAPGWTTIENSGTREELSAAVDAYWAEHVQPALDQVKAASTDA
ncbi:Ectoine, glycine betaine and proline transport system membrane protein [Micrococcus lylae]|uniref:Dephospho-CoA kinase n=1 Tax=Micrococcus lylae TaxID=1273 RepID=A0A1R4ID21_9MICC|nr:dephospho-CoA kinase [Micrococcus lylae]SJN17737.1 Ectoine, glycine betaine and proline transport system membrane protein [Micrococcus lylae]